MAIVIYKTDNLIVSSIEDAEKLVIWAADKDNRYLLQGKTIIAAIGSWFEAKEPTSHNKRVTNAFKELVKYSHHWNMTIILIMNDPQYLDPFFKRYVSGVKDLQLC